MPRRRWPAAPCEPRSPRLRCASPALQRAGALPAAGRDAAAARQSEGPAPRKKQWHCAHLLAGEEARIGGSPRAHVPVRDARAPQVCAHEGAQARYVRGCPEVRCDAWAPAGPAAACQAARLACDSDRRAICGARRSPSASRRAPPEASVTRPSHSSSLKKLSSTISAGDSEACARHTRKQRGAAATARRPARARRNSQS